MKASGFSMTTTSSSTPRSSSPIQEMVTSPVSRLVPTLAGAVTIKCQTWRLPIRCRRALRLNRISFTHTLCQALMICKALFFRLLGRTSLSPPSKHQDRYALVASAARSPRATRLRLRPVVAKGLQPVAHRHHLCGRGAYAKERLAEMISHRPPANSTSGTFEGQRGPAY